MYAVDSHICRNKKGTLNLYAPTTDQPFIGGIMALLKRTPEQNAAFERCVGFLAEMIESTAGRWSFPFFPLTTKRVGTVYPIHHLKQIQKNH